MSPRTIRIRIQNFAERANDARDHVRTLHLSNYDAIVIISGDGLCYEVLNGIMSREDREKALKMPLGIVPGGSGNALAAGIMHACK